MTYTRRELAVLLAAAPAAVAAMEGLPRKARGDCFFGLHFDLHPGPEDPALGRDVTDAAVEKILVRAKPDFVQYDSKGHVGWLGWPSEVGPSAPHIVNDSLAVWRRVTARRGIALFIHFSGVWDSQAVERHPEWARLDAKGKSDGKNTSTSSAYVDELMIRQLREAAAKYDLDGAWVDGECWTLQPDYHPAALAAWRKATGRSEAPKDKSDPAWNEFLDFNREQFRRYVRHYVTEVHKTNPKFQIASNWLYSTFVPEKPELPVDFLSGDYLGNASISTARLEARYLQQTGRPWDLMAWGFQQSDSNAIGHVFKPAAQLRQEASVVLAQGGGFQVYYIPSREGHFEESHIETMGKVADFCRARQQWSHKTETVPQIGVVFSKRTLYTTADRMFGGWGKHTDPARGWLDALVDCQYSADVLPDWKLDDALLGRYRMVVLPDWAAPGDEVKRALLEWAAKGGRLVVAGAENTRLFAAELGLKLSGEAAKTECFLAGGEVLANVTGLWQPLESDGRVIERRFLRMDSTREFEAAAVAVPHGKGEVVVIAGPVGRVYAATHAPAVRQLLRRVIEPRFEPLVRVTAPPVVEVALRRRGKTLLVHLLNNTGMQVAGDFAAVDYVAPVESVTLEFRGASRPEIRVQPEGRALAPARTSKGWIVTLERLELHSILEANGVLS